jgi:MHS family shikimate/dehydroshikimate transporter-like MFS transporter
VSGGAAQHPITHRWRHGARPRAASPDRGEESDSGGPVQQETFEAGRAKPSGMTRRAIAGCIVGGALEWYDYFIFATASALIFGQIFFPNSSPIMGTLQSFGAFAVGQVVRPLGAIILGNLGDRLGRKPVLVLTFMLMGVSTLAIGLLPTYASVGVLAPVLLVVLRLFQGLGAGAEFAGASIMGFEYADPKRRGLFGSIGSIGSASGLTLGTGTFVLLQFTMSEETLLAWGWRLPFIFSALLIAVGFYIRSRVDESPLFAEVKAKNVVERLPLKRVIREEWRSLLTVGGLAAALQMGTYVFLTYIIAYLTGQAGTSRSFATYAVAGAGVAAVIVTPLFGALSDRIGRRPVFGGAALLAAILVVPYFALIGSGNSFLIALAVIVQGGIVIQAMAGTQGALFAELFTTRVRYSGFAMGREVSAAIFGGLSPLIATALVAWSGGRSWSLSIYLIAVMLLTVTVVLFIPETYRKQLQD